VPSKSTAGRTPHWRLFCVHHGFTPSLLMLCLISHSPFCWILLDCGLFLFYAHHGFTPSLLILFNLNCNLQVSVERFFKASITQCKSINCILNLCREFCVFFGESWFCSVSSYLVFEFWFYDIWFTMLLWYELNMLSMDGILA